MIFCGDTVFPENYSNQILDSTDKDFVEKQKIINLESVIQFDEMERKTSGIALLSSKNIINFLKKINVISCCQANNHITDYRTSIKKQKENLLLNNIHSFGAGDNLEEASKAFFYLENDIQYAILAFGWEVISCKAATSTKPGINPLEYNNVIKQIDSFFESYPGTKLICIFHWDYEFEIYPQPSHTQLAFKLIDKGVEAIIGHHPHIVQGFESYKNKPIFYSLGNFYFPNANYNGHEIKFSEEAKHGLCVELKPNIKKINLYWTYLKDNKKLLVLKKEKLFNSEKINKLSQFSGMSHKEYIDWFKKNRIKRKLLPIYKTIDSKIEISINDNINLFRQSIINFLVKIGLKK